MKKIFIPCMAVLLCIACTSKQQKVQDQQATDSIPFPETPVQQNSATAFTDLIIDDEVLLKTFYGTAAKNEGAEKFSTVLSLPLQVNFRKETQNLIESSEDESIEITVSDKKYFGTEDQFCVCVTDGFIKGNDCHPCGGTLGMFILKKNDKGKWDCIHQNYDIRQQGSYGGISADAVVYEISKGEYAVDLSSGYSAMGCSSQNSYSFILLDGSFQAIEIASTEEDGDSFYFDNSGACDAENTELAPCYDFSSSISFVPSDKEDGYYDFKVVTKGTIAEEGDTHKTIPYYRTRTYEWKADKYVLIGDSNIE